MTVSQTPDEAIDPSEQPRQQTLSTAEPGVKAAFELSWQELDPMTQCVGLLLSLFAPAIFRWKWVEFASQLLNWDEADVNQAKQQFYKWQWLQSVERGEECYNVPPLIRRLLREKLDDLDFVAPYSCAFDTVFPETASDRNTEVGQKTIRSLSPYQGGDIKKAFGTVMVNIAEQIPDSLTDKDIESVKDAIPHLEEVAQNLTTVVRDEDLLWIFDRLGRFYKAKGSYILAEPWLEQCLAIAQASFGDNHLDVATSLNNLAELYYSQKRYSEAEPLLLKALGLRTRFLGNYHPDVATSLNNLAGLYYAQKRYSEAEPLLLKALELRTHFLGNYHPDVAATLNNLALLYDAQGNYSEAETLYVQALELRKRLLGNDHPHVGITLNNLAGLYCSQGRYTEAEPLFRQAIEISEQVLGANHLNSQIFHKNLAILQSRIDTNNSWLRMLTKKFWQLCSDIKSS